jgi:hypothetical protein
MKTNVLDPMNDEVRTMCTEEQLDTYYQLQYNRGFALYIYYSDLQNCLVIRYPENHFKIDTDGYIYNIYN